MTVFMTSSIYNLAGHITTSKIAKAKARSGFPLRAFASRRAWNQCGSAGQCMNMNAAATATATQTPAAKPRLSTMLGLVRLSL